LIQCPGEQFIAKEIQEKVKVSKGGLNQSLRKLAKEGFVNREKKGKIYLYSLNYNNAIVKQFKILKNVELLFPLVSKLKIFAEKIILFGSSARGEDTAESDIDLFVLTKNYIEIDNVLKKDKLRRKLQTIIRTSVEYSGMEQKEQVFYEEIKRGITLWENKE
jgi:predicted nucleotidyltransferase